MASSLKEVRFQAADLSSKIAAISEKADTEAGITRPKDLKMETPNTNNPAAVASQNGNAKMKLQFALSSSKGATPEPQAPATTVEPSDLIAVEEPKPKASASQEKKQKPSKTKKAPASRRLAFADDHADDGEEEDSGEDEQDEEDSDDRAFVAGDNEIEYEDSDEENGEAAQKKKKKKRSSRPVDPFRAEQLKREAKEAKLLAAAYENGVSKKKRDKLLKSVTGIKGAGVDKTYEVDELDAEQDQRIADEEADKMLGNDEEEEDLSEDERVRRELEEDEAEATQKNNKNGKATGFNLNLSDDDDDDDAMETSEKREEEETKKPKKPASPQPAKGVVKSVPILLDDEDAEAKKKKDAVADDDDDLELIPSDDVLLTGMVNHGKLVKDQAPHIKRILIESRNLAQHVPAPLIEAMTAASFLAINSGALSTNTRAKSNKEMLGNISDVLEPFTAPLGELAVALVKKMDLGRRLEHHELFPLVLTCGADVFEMRVVQSVRAAKALMCPFTGQVIDKGQFMNLVLILCSNLTTKAGKKVTRVMYAPLALQTASSKSSSSSNNNKKASSKAASSPVPKISTAAATIAVADEKQQQQQQQKKPSTPAKVAKTEMIEEAPKKTKKTSKAEEATLDAMDIDAKPTNAKEEADDEDEEHEMDEESAMAAEPTDPHARLEQHYDLIVIKKVAVFAKQHDTIEALANDPSHAAIVAWKAKAGGSVPLFEPDTSLPKMAQPWANLTTVGLIDSLFELVRIPGKTRGERDAHIKEHYASLPRAKSYIALRKADADAKIINNINLKVFEGQEKRLLNVILLAEKFRATHTPEKLAASAGALLVSLDANYDDDRIKPLYANPTKTGEYYLERIRFLPRLLAQLLLPEPVYK